MITTPKTHFVSLSLALFFLSSPLMANPLEHGLSTGGQPGVVQTYSATPSVPRSWHLSTSGRYGFGKSLLVEDDLRQRADARFSLAYAPLAGLQIGLSIEGLLYTYRWPGNDDDGLVVGALGDPRISLRTGWNLGDNFALGGLVELWIPSAQGSLNVTGQAISPIVLLMLSFVPERIPLGLHFNFGYQHDRSANVFGDMSNLTPEHLVLSGASSALHSLVLKLAVEYRIGPAAPFIECLGNVIVSDGATAQSPVVVGLGARFWFGPADEVQIHLAAHFRARGAPDVPDPEAGTLWPTPPQFDFGIGFTFRLPVRQGQSVSSGPDDPDDPDDPESPEEREFGRIEGTVDCGIQSCSDQVRILVQGTDSSALAVEPNGSFRTMELAEGTYNLEMTSPGVEPQTREVEVRGGRVAEANFAIEETSVRQASGIQGRITDFNGEPIVATLRIPVLDIELQSSEDGTFETEAEHGRYEVIVSAPGYQTQSTHVVVSEGGVVVMNIELRPRRRR